MYDPERSIMKTEEKKQSKTQIFVSYVIERIKNDNGFGATLRRADNPDTEYQSWEHLSKWCNLEKEWERLPFAVVGSALARSKPSKDGMLGIGKAIAKAYSREGSHNGSEENSAKAKLRRLLACKTIPEVCGILRSTLRLIESRDISVNHANLLNDLLFFNGYYSGRKPRIRAYS